MEASAPPDRHSTLGGALVGLRRGFGAALLAVLVAAPPLIAPAQGSEAEGGSRWPSA